MAQSDSTRPLHEQFEAQARRTPDATAVYEADGSITFAELDAQAGRVAQALRAKGIGTDCVVGVHVDRSVAWIIAVLGILKTDAAAMPLPPSYPPGRVRRILSRAAPAAVIDDAPARLHRGLGARVFDLGELRSFASSAGSSMPGRLDQAAFVLCSSGSTGTPKMIVRSHGSFLHRLNWTWTRHPYAAGEVCCQKAQAGTTHCIYELFEPLLRGVPVVSIPDDEARDLEAFWETVRRRSVSRLLLVPSMLQSSLDMPGFTPPPLEVLVLMGEYVSPRLAERAVNEFPARTHIYSIYGSTEASSALVCDLRESFRAGEELPLGKPVSNDVQTLVLGANLEAVGSGEIGRLHIAGPALFSEYFREPDLTESVFPAASRHAGRWYDTHDRVRLMPDGNLQFMGRDDATVKVRGFRVDLQEVERAMLSYSGVRSAAAVVGNDPSGRSMLLGFVTPATVDRQAVYDALRDLLPAYMIPSSLTALDAFPITPRGKLDRARLLEQQASRAAPTPASRVPSNTESRIAAIWTQVLGHDAYSLESSFFEVGGTSLTVFALVHRLRLEFALDRSRLPEQILYRYPTIETLAPLLERLESGEAAGAERGAMPVLVTMRRGSDPALAPFFVVASAGGTLGAYEMLAKKLATPREIIGVRDPFIWGERELSEGFDRWVGRYVAAIRERQAHGPYYVCAYSSAGAFGYEIARRLRAAGEEVAILVLVDPLALDRRNRLRYGWWALRVTYARPSVRALVRLAGWLRVPVYALLRIGRQAPPAPAAPSEKEVRQLTEDATRDVEHLRTFSALLELNTGLPLALEDSDFAGVPPDGRLRVLQARIASRLPEVDAATIERILIQYGFQVRSQHAYQLQPYDGPVLLVEPATKYAGLVRAHLAPYVRDLRFRVIALGSASERVRKIAARLGSLRAHYRSMRDEEFVNGLCREIEAVLE